MEEPSGEGVRKVGGVDELPVKSSGGDGPDEGKGGEDVGRPWGSFAP